jgi:transglutaminase-like putative cysteine protease
MKQAQKDHGSIRPIRVVLIVFLVSTLVLAVFLCYLTYILPEEHGPEGRFFTITITVTYENKNDATEAWNLTESDMTIGLFMNNSWQTVYLTNSSHAVKIFKTDGDGNTVAVMDFPTKIEPGGNFSYEVTYRVILRQASVPQIAEDNSGTLSDTPADLKNSYCRSEGTWQVNDSRLTGLAYEIAGNETKVLTILKKFIAWIHGNITYNSAEIPRYPNETLSERRGDCDDQANLLITFCRIVGIPAYLQIGCIYPPRGGVPTTATYWGGHLKDTLLNIGWHGWAMVFVPPWGWLPVDLTYVSGGLDNDPLNAIKSSAIITAPTVQYINITRTDYAGDSRNLRDFVMSHDFYIYEQDTMSEENTERVTEISVPSSIRM